MNEKPIKRAKRYIVPKKNKDGKPFSEYQDYQNMLANVLRWFYEQKEYKKIQADFKLHATEDLSSGACDIVIRYHNGTIELIEYKLGDRRDYQPGKQKQHITQVKNYKKMILAQEADLHPESVRCKVVYFSRTQDSPEVIEVD